MSSLKCVLFDLDGTLLDTSPDFLTATNLLLAKKQLPLLAQHQIAPLITNGSAGIIEKVFGCDSKAPHFKQLQKELLDLYLLHIADQTALYPGMDNVLQLLRFHAIPWGIVTNKPATYTEPLVKALQLDSAITICPDHVSQPKPSPEGLFMAAKQLAIACSDMLYVGDHNRDIEAAKAANMPSVAAAYGFLDEHQDPSTWNADYIIHSADELVPIIKRRLNPTCDS